MFTCFSSKAHSAREVSTFWSQRMLQTRNQKHSQIKCSPPKTLVGEPPRSHHQDRTTDELTHQDHATRITPPRSLPKITPPRSSHQDRATKITPPRSRHQDHPTPTPKNCPTRSRHQDHPTPTPLRHPDHATKIAPRAHSTKITPPRSRHQDHATPTPKN